MGHEHDPGENPITNPVLDPCSLPQSASESWAPHLSVLPLDGAVDAAGVEAARLQIEVQQVQHARHLAEDQHLHRIEWGGVGWGGDITGTISPMARPPWALSRLDMTGALRPGPAAEQTTYSESASAIAGWCGPSHFAPCGGFLPNAHSAQHMRCHVGSMSHHHRCTRCGRG